MFDFIARNQKINAKFKTFLMIRKIRFKINEDLNKIDMSIVKDVGF